MRRAYVFLGDLLRSIESLRIGEPEVARQVMRMLSLEHFEAGPLGAREGAFASPSPPVREMNPPRVIPEKPGTQEEVPDEPDRKTATSARLRKLSSSVTPTQPAWFANVTALPRASVQEPSPATLAPLFPARETRVLLSAALASWQSDGPLDIPRIVQTLAELRPLRELPRTTAASLRCGVQVVVDAGPGMAPFRGDVEHLLRAIASLLPPDRMHIYRFTGTPLRKCVAAGESEPRRYLPPGRHTPVLLVTDLGIGDQNGLDERPDDDEWLQLAEFVQRAGCPFAAIVPYGPDRWPRALMRAIPIIRWDRRTTAATVRRRVLEAARRRRP